MSSMQRLDLRNSAMLVVDDNEQSLNLMVQMLAGFRVRPGTCPSAAEAKAALRISRFDLVIVDGEMPDEDGIELVRHIRADRHGPNFAVPVLLVAAHTPVNKIVQARDAGANLVVRKPVSPTILLSRIEWLARSTRQFVDSPDYRGPDRRFRVGPPPPGVEERRSDVLALTANPDRSLSQNEVDSLFD
jgi:DNA-binding response OmpR family regulator